MMMSELLTWKSACCGGRMTVNDQRVTEALFAFTEVVQSLKSSTLCAGGGGEFPQCSHPIIAQQEGSLSPAPLTHNLLPYCGENISTFLQVLCTEHHAHSWWCVTHTHTASGLGFNMQTHWNKQLELVVRPRLISCEEGSCCLQLWREQI